MFRTLRLRGNTTRERILAFDRHREYICLLNKYYMRALQLVLVRRGMPVCDAEVDKRQRSLAN